MPLFDIPKQENLSDQFPAGTLFWMLGAKYEGVQPTSYGDSEQAAIVVCPVGDTTAQKQYRVWGTLAQQIRQMEPGDLPAEVEVRKQGRKNIFVLSKSLQPQGVTQVSVEQRGEEDIPF